MKFLISTTSQFDHSETLLDLGRRTPDIDQDKLHTGKTSAIPGDIELNAVSESAVSDCHEEPTETTSGHSQEQDDRKCILCSKVFNSKWNLLRHKKKCKGRFLVTFTCEICKKDFRTMKTFQNHRSQRCVMYCWKCRICDEKFTSQEALHVHRRRNHHEEECELCFQIVLRKNMRKHMRTHKGLTPAKSKKLFLKNKAKMETSHVCDICDKVYYDGSTLTRHQKRIHFKVNESDQTEQTDPIESEVGNPENKSVEQESLVDSNEDIKQAVVDKDRIELTGEAKDRLIDVLEGLDTIFNLSAIKSRSLIDLDSQFVRNKRKNLDFVILRLLVTMTNLYEIKDVEGDVMINFLGTSSPSSNLERKCRLLGAIEKLVKV